jgi:hypothetical protein
VKGEPINAIVLIRNVDEKTLRYRGVETTLKFNVATQKRLIRNNFDASRIRGGRETLDRRHQNKYSISLDKWFDISALGEYVITGVLTVPEQTDEVIIRPITTQGEDENGVFGIRTNYLRIPAETGVYHEVWSGNAIIKIIDPQNTGNSQLETKGAEPNSTDLSSHEIDQKSLQGQSKTIVPSQPEAFETTTSETLAPDTYPSVNHQRGISSLDIQETNWRVKFSWGTLSFLFLVLAYIFYRAHRRSVHSKG